MADTVIRPSIKLIKAGYMAVVLLALIGFGCLANDESLRSVAIALFAAAGLCALMLIRGHIKRRLIKITLGSQHLRYEAGVFSKSTRIIQLPKVQDVRVDQSLVQRMLNIGNLSIETAGEASRLTIENIDAPQSVAEQILIAAGKEDSTTHGL